MKNKTPKFNKTGLSKSSFVKGHQCVKALYLHKYHEEHDVEVEEPSAALQAIFSQGHVVGKLAQERHPGGLNALPNGHLGIAKGIEDTKKWMADPNVKVIYEACVTYQGVFAALDILVRDGNGWKIYEVKSSTKVKHPYPLDAGLQYWVMTKLGFKVKDVFVTHINTGYERKAELDVQKLFSDSTVLTEAKSYQKEIGKKVKSFKEALSKKDIPKVEIGDHCSNPYSCDFKNHCWPEIPKYSIFDLYYGGKKSKELYERGVEFIKDIPEGTVLTPLQKMQVDAEKTGVEYVNNEEIQNFLESIEYPIAHMDFETYNGAVPEFSNSRPYQFMLFQWSCHVQTEKASEPIHKGFLADVSQDPRVPFIEALIEATKDAKTIFVYNIGFEVPRLKELAKQLPHYSKDITTIIDRVVDLATPFQKKWYYTKEMKGKYSIKYVLPAIVPELTYDNLEIGNGGDASSSFLNLKHESNQDVINTTRENLIEYCQRDTYAMVKLLEKLYDVSCVI